MAKRKFKKVTVRGVTTVSATLEGEPYVASPDTHPNYDQIIQALEEGKLSDRELIKLFEPLEVVKEFAGTKELSERLTVRNRGVYWDGDKVDHSLADQILRFVSEGLDFQPLVNFWDKISQNPNPESQKLLYGYLRSHKFTITPEGDILGYKGYHKDGIGFKSTHAGTAWVNGKEQRGQIPCKKGDVVTMPRGSVDSNPHSDCSVGLHIGSPSYARKFGNIRVAVLINPRDVVSVPARDSGEKMRVCRYYVLDVMDTDHVSALIANAPKWDIPKPAKATVTEKTQAAPTTTSGKGSKILPKKEAPPEQPESSVLEDEKPAKPPAMSPEEKKERRRQADRDRRAAAKQAKEAGAEKDAKATAGKAATSKSTKTVDTLPPKPEPGNGKDTTKVDWNDPKNVKKLLACRNNEEMRRAFPSLALSTLQRRAREERAKQAGARQRPRSSPPDK